MRQVTQRKLFGEQRQRAVEISQELVEGVALPARVGLGELSNVGAAHLRNGAQYRLCFGRQERSLGGARQARDVLLEYR